MVHDALLGCGRLKERPLFAKNVGERGGDTIAHYVYCVNIIRNRRKLCLRRGSMDGFFRTVPRSLAVARFVRSH